MKLYDSDKRRGIHILVGVLIFITFAVFIYELESKNTDFTKQPGYEQMLESAIANKNEEIRIETEKKMAGNGNYFLVSEEMKQDPKYQNLDGSLNMELICKEFGVSSSPTEGALKETGLLAVDNHMEPHVLAGAEVAIYSNKEGKPWKLKKGDKVTFHTYVDTEYYNCVNSLYFGALKAGEPFLVDNLEIDNPERGGSIDSERELKYIIPETGEYQFYLFRGSMEPIIIKWIDISIN